MSAEIFKAAAIETSLVGGHGGVFDVRLDGKLIFSKQNCGRFPRAGEIAELVGS